jgi:hypothetical protein
VSGWPCSVAAWVVVALCYATGALSVLGRQLGAALALSGVPTLGHAAADRRDAAGTAYQADAAD